MFDNRVVIICTQQARRKDNTMEWHIVFPQEVVELHLQGADNQMLTEKMPC